VGGTKKNTKPVFIRAPEETSHQISGSGCIIGLKIFGSRVRAPRSRAKYDDFYSVTPVLIKAVSGEPDSMLVDLQQNKCIVIFRIILVPRSAELATLQPYLFTSKNRFYVRFLDKVGRWRNHSVTGRALLFFCQISRMGVLPPLLFCIQANQKCSCAPGP